MSSSNQFTYTKATLGSSISRSKWKMPHRWQGAVFHGDLVPIEITRIMPGDNFSYPLKNLTQTATPPIFPIADNIYENFAAFFVPDRLVWNKAKQYFGENEEGYGIQSEVLAPRSILSIPDKTNALTTYKRSLATYLGIIRQTNQSGSYISVNPIRAYLAVYNYWFRNQNFMDPYLWNKGQAGDGYNGLASLGGSTINLTSDVPVVCKKLDVFTSCLPWSQKLASPVSLPLGTEAPIEFISDSSLTPSAVFENISGVVKTGTTDVVDLNAIDENGGSTLSGKLVANLRNATAANINQLRMSVALQRYYESLARCGSFYSQYIKQFFDVDTGDKTAQVPEFLGGITRRMNVAAIYSTAGYEAGQTTKLGARGGAIVTEGNDMLFRKAFTEFGYLVIVYYTKHDRAYGQGIDPIFRKHKVLEEYNPKFAHIGEVPVEKSRIYFTGDESTDSSQFLGMQEPWNEYRYINDKVISFLNPSLSNSYNFINLADNYASAPVLNADFLKENRDSIYRCLSGGESSPDYFVDVFIDAEVIRPMPVHSIPGLMDHF